MVGAFLVVIRLFASCPDHGEPFVRGHEKRVFDREPGSVEFEHDLGKGEIIHALGQAKERFDRTRMADDDQPVAVQTAKYALERFAESTSSRVEQVPYSFVKRVHHDERACKIGDQV